MNRDAIRSAILNDAILVEKGGNVFGWAEEPVIDELAKVSGRSFVGYTAEGDMIRVLTFDASAAVSSAPAGARGVDGSAILTGGAVLHLPVDLAAIAGGKAEAWVDQQKALAAPAPAPAPEPEPEPARARKPKPKSKSKSKPAKVKGKATR